jgi:hypothetical protein
METKTKKTVGGIGMEEIIGLAAIMIRIGGKMDMMTRIMMTRSTYLIIIPKILIAWKIKST